MHVHAHLSLNHINEVIRRIRDQLLEAEVRCHQGLSLHIKVNEEKHIRLDHQHQQLDLDLGMCVHRLQEARACNRILEEKVSDQQAH